MKTNHSVRFLSGRASLQQQPKELIYRAIDDKNNLIASNKNDPVANRQLSPKKSYKALNNLQPVLN